MGGAVSRRCVCPLPQARVITQLPSYDPRTRSADSPLRHVVSVASMNARTSDQGVLVFARNEASKPACAAWVSSTRSKRVARIHSMRARPGGRFASVVATRRPRFANEKSAFGMPGAQRSRQGIRHGGRAPSSSAPSAERKTKSTSLASSSAVHRKRQLLASRKRSEGRTAIGAPQSAAPATDAPTIVSASAVIRMRRPSRSHGFLPNERAGGSPWSRAGRISVMLIGERSAFSITD